MIEKRQENADYLQWELEDLPISKYTAPIKNTFNHSFMFFPAYAERRDELMIYLEKQGIQSRTMMPLISQPITKPYLKEKYPVAQYIGEKGILLPVHQYLKKKDLTYMVEKIEEFYNA